MIPNFKFETQFQGLGYDLIAGVDEVGRGALAGPIVAAAVIFSGYQKIKNTLRGVDDSKKITEKDRCKLDLLIRKEAFDCAIGEVTVAEIEKMGIGAANILAFKRALDNLVKVDFALIDGRRFRGFDRKYFCLEKGESHSLSIAAASIIAKVYRDDLMSKIDRADKYYFSENKGYGCEKHYQALEKFGSSKDHRSLFLRKFNQQKETNSLFDA